ncbi:hypothetical protein GCM10008908_34860 [Clostridium subterminale]|uniref:Uncharacterized protein n=1 Tax=Clostridium subterminale TaxID=1550 RepID=A0ABN1KX99_CLOSU
MSIVKISAFLSSNSKLYKFKEILHNKKCYNACFKNIYLAIKIRSWKIIKIRGPLFFIQKTLETLIYKEFIK